MVTMEELFQDIKVHSFDEEDVDKICEKMIKISQLDPHRPITLQIDTYGGSIAGLTTLIEAMESIPNPIITHATGKCCSAGTFLLAAGDYRFAGPHTRLMIHEVSSGARGHVKDMIEGVEETKFMNEYWFDFMDARCEKPKGYIRQVLKDKDLRDMFLSPEEAQLHGLIDKVGAPIIRPIMMYQITCSKPKDYGKARDQFRKISAEMDKFDAEEKEQIAAQDAIMQMLTKKVAKADPKKKQEKSPVAKPKKKVKQPKEDKPLLGTIC